MPKPEYNFEDNLKIFKEICDSVAGGERFRDACTKAGKNPMWYYRFLSANSSKPEVRELSTHARQQKAHSYFDKCEDILDKLEKKEMEYGTAKVLFDSYLRLAGKANQGVYGDKQSVELSGSPTSPVVVRKEIDLEELSRLHYLIHDETNNG